MYHDCPRSRLVHTGDTSRHYVLSLAFLGTPLTCEGEHFEKSTGDDGEFRTRCTTAATGQVTYTHFGLGIACASELVEDFSVNHCAACLQRMCTEELALVKLEGAVDIADAQFEDETHKGLPSPGVELA